MKLTASKMSIGALASEDNGRGTSRSCRVRRLDRVGTLVGISRVGIASGRVGSRSFGGVRVGTTGRVVTAWDGSGSCKSGKEESRDDFELHIACFLCCSAED